MEIIRLNTAGKPGQEKLNIDSYIRQELEENIGPLVERIVHRLKTEATPAYALMPKLELVNIVKGALKQTTRWIENGPPRTIEKDLEDGLAGRLEMGFSVQDFLSTTVIIEAECRNYCRRLFAANPKAAERSDKKLAYIYVNVNLIETRLALKYRLEGIRQIS